ncbi:uncharacterized protein ARMOST_15499 [Armillaria ostoyae]|uniref:Uncharacterized protein n=1 Tax=Armillaria ostoyae TaxID=47428 RepID=A0A284RTJ1_ARMOS|nr:uncharacterized protein ARMOST_15499 [Armillaria ostoyae]
MPVTVALPEDVVRRLLPTLSFVVQEVEKEGGDANDYRVLVRALACSLVDHANSDDDQTLAGSSPIKPLPMTRPTHSPDVGYNSPVLHDLHEDNTLPRPCQHVHRIVHDPDEGPVLKRARMDDAPGDDEGMGPEPEIIEVSEEDTQEGSPGDKGEGRIEDNLDIVNDEEEGREEDMEGADFTDAGDMGDDEEEEEDGDEEMEGLADSGDLEDTVNVEDDHEEEMEDSSDAGDAGDSDSDSDYNPGAAVAHLLLPGQCKRKGHKKQEKSSRRKRVGNAKRRGRGKKGRPNWTNSTTLPPPTTNSLQLLARLSTVSSQQEFVQALHQITAQLMKPSLDSVEWDDMSLGAIGKRCQVLEKSEGLCDYKLMLSYLQLMLTCDGRYKEARWKGKKGPSVEQCAREAGTTTSNFQTWRSQGTRLLYLASAASPFLLLLFAATQMRVDICRSKSSSMEDISGFAWALRCSEPKHPYHKLVQDLILPQLQCLLDLAPNAPWFKLTFWDDVNHCWSRRHFSDVVSIRDILDKAEVNFFYLPPPSEIWTCLTPAPMPDPDSSYKMAPVHTIKTGFRVPTNRCPFNTEEALEWTAVKRETALKAVPVSSLSELEEKLDGFYDSKGKKNDPDSYILIDTGICEGQTLFIQDADSQLVAIMIPNMADCIPHVQHSIVPQLQTTWPGEFVRNHSDRPNYSYFCWHGSYYNRYAERGYDAPESASPYFTLKEGQTTVHIQRRAPGHSKEFLQDIGEADLLAKLFQDVMSFVNVRALLPGIYKELTVFVDHLPLNDHSPAYPFSGFVINVGVATDGHRDGFDKLACVVIPFGKWTGGELCLYEAGFVWRLKPWDILIFPSGRITHFNLHFTGLRGSLVMHSDKGGDAWAQGEELGYNGWSHAVAR